MTKVARLATASLGLLLLTGCSDGPADSTMQTTGVQAQEFPWPEGGKSDVFGRALIGLASPYPADTTLSRDEDRLRSEMGYRRQVAWSIAKRVLSPVPLLGLADRLSNTPLDIEGGVPTVPRWQTWYGVDDFKRTFRRLYADLGPDGRKDRIGLDEMTIDAAID